MPPGFVAAPGTLIGVGGGLLLLLLRRCIIMSSSPSNKKGSDLTSASAPDTLAAFQVNPDAGLTRAEVDVCRKEHGYNEVAEQKGHPLLRFLGKFWGVSAWMLELIMLLSAVLRKYSDLVVVGALLVINAVLSFAQEHRAAGVVATLRHASAPATSSRRT